ncbi:MAG: hypothetical protein Q9O62_07580 [Ardenticatenia bacterium]|nr:hypothetical protein [Ardenticatenia bacterium]
MCPVRPLPSQGWSRERVLDHLHTLKVQPPPWEHGRLFSLLYDAGPEVRAVLREASLLFAAENALNPLAFPSLRRMETEVVAAGWR